MSKRPLAETIRQTASLDNLHRLRDVATSRSAITSALLLLVLGIAIFAYAALHFAMPPQYRFVIADSVERAKPFAYAVAILSLYALLLFWMLRAGRRLNPFWAVLAASPVLIFLVATFAVARMSLVLAIAALIVVMVLAIGFWALTPEARWNRVPELLRSVWPALIAGAVVYFGGAAAVSASPIELPRELGTPFILALFVGFVMLFGAAAILKPVFGACLAIYSVIAIFLFGPNDHRIPAIATEQAMAGPLRNRPDMRVRELDPTFEDWLARRADLSAYRNASRPYPVIFVSSEGGGIYAAAHAYGALAQFAAHCPTFSQHVFATVGVSGGALGNALFAASVNPTQNYYQPCGGQGRPVEAGTFGLDHLSPVVARFLLIEPIDRLLPGKWMKRDRAQILADSFLQTAGDKAFLSRRIGESFDTSEARPAVISVGVNVASGRRFVMSPFNPREYGGTGEWWPGRNPFTEEEEAGPEISVINAAGVSARFPWITPTGRVSLTDKKDVILADGGYFDNSGADTVLDLITAIRARNNWASNVGDEESDMPLLNERNECVSQRIRVVRNFHQEVRWQPCEIVVFLVHFAIASSEGGAAVPKSQSFLFDPIKTLISTRASRGEIALSRADLDLCGTFYSGAECLVDPTSSLGFFRNNIAPREMDLPLGWYMPAKSFDRMLNDAVPVALFDYRRTRKEGASDLEFMMYHLDPGLYAPGADPNIGDLMPDP